MPKGSPELTNARRCEIVEACAQLYRTLPFKDITIGLISAKTSFTRTSVYNYFRTKEEIFLALLEREYAAWIADLDALSRRGVPREEFAQAFSRLLEDRQCMLRLMSMNLYDMEAGSGMDALVRFKRVYNDSINAVVRCLKRHFPSCTDDTAYGFVYSFYPFLFGVYPYTSPTDKQVAAMEAAHVSYKNYTFSHIPCELVRKLIFVF